MKTRLLTLILAIGFITLMGCNIDYDNSANISPLHGLWNMKNAVPPYMNFDDGLITYTFDTKNLILTVENNHEFIIHHVMPSGTYPYTIVEYEGHSYIIFEHEYWHHSFEGEAYGFRLKLSESDGDIVFIIDTGRANGGINVPTDQVIWRLER